MAKGEIDQVFTNLKTRLRLYKREFGMEVLERTRARTPVVTGEMKAGWGFTEKATELEFWNVSDHSAYVEFGTPTQAPQAPLRRTLLEANEITQIAAERAKK